MGVSRALSVPHRPSSIVHRPSSIVHRPSSIVHRPSSIVHRPSSIVHHGVGHGPGRKRMSSARPLGPEAPPATHTPSLETATVPNGAPYSSWLPGLGARLH